MDLPTLMFTSTLFSEFIVSIYSMDMAPDRRRDVHDCLLQRGVGFAAALVIGPLYECEIGSEMFAFYLDRLAGIHRFSPQILAVLFA
jgi:hypothetical protein